MAKPLQGQTVLITGGARRLGRAIALKLASAGADVAITFRNSAREAQATVIDLSSFGVRAVALRCDITDEKSVRGTMKEVARELGGLDILINNAANYETVNFEKLTVKQWDATFASNTYTSHPSELCDSISGSTAGKSSRRIARSCSTFR